ncbi:oxidoreductase [Kitasatospora griseola]|uniref:NADH-quinone oxidoreductase subunit B family protein n=1 Tax=Kitasatospora griseola TaxID=2064 RepID=UPI003855C3E1
MTAPRLAVWKFSSCDGCQLTLLDLEDELVSLSGELEIGFFLEATSDTLPPPYDLSLVEGSVAAGADLERIRWIREQSRRLVTIGACATAGGVQALRNLTSLSAYQSVVYARPDYLDSLDDSTPISAHVPVDFELRGCPIDKRQLLEVITAFLADRKPDVPTHSVCFECKLRGATCVTVAHGTPCLGPVTHAGCGALCPAYGRGCYGCFGPVPTTPGGGGPNTRAMLPLLRRDGLSKADIARLYRTFNAEAPEFAEAARQAEEDTR